MMISTVNTDVIESILNRKLKFDDFNFKPLSWQDALPLSELILALVHKQAVLYLS